MAALKPEQVLDRLRRICLSLPETSEKESWGHPNFRVGKKIFAAFEQYKGEWAICVRVPKQHQWLFLKDPRFYSSPYGGRHGWISLRVAGRLDWAEIRKLVAESYQVVSTKR